MFADRIGRAAVVIAGLAAAPAAGPPAGVTLTAAGDRLVITGDDPRQVALAHDLARMLLKAGPEPYQVFRLKHANAAETARVLDEWFNGTAPPAREVAGPAFGASGGPGPRPVEPAPSGGQPRVRIVPEPATNSLLVRAKALDLATIRTLLDSVLDAGAGDSKAVMKPFFLGPLQYAVAAEVVAVLKEVYQESTGGSHTAGGVATFAGPFGAAALGTRQPAVDAVGRPKPVTLTLAADDRTNTVVGMATELMAADIAGVVKLLEERAERSRKVVQLVPTVGLDPSLVQEVLDAIQGRSPTPRRDHDDAGGWGAGAVPFGPPRGAGLDGGFGPPAGAGAPRPGGARGAGRSPGG